jgi:hypothetical protein
VRCCPGPPCRTVDNGCGAAPARRSSASPTPTCREPNADNPGRHKVRRQRPRDQSPPGDGSVNAVGTGGPGATPTRRRTAGDHVPAGVSR